MNTKDKIMIVFGIQESLGDILEKEYNNKPPETVKKMIDDLRSKTKVAFKTWKYDIQSRDLERIGNYYKDIQKKSSVLNKGVEVVVYIGLCVGVLVDMMSNIKDKHRRKILNDILMCMKKFDRYYSRRSDIDYFYEQAKIAYFDFTNVVSL